MIVLAIESSASAASCVILDGDTLRASAYQNSGLTHSATLMPMICDMLKNCRMELREIDALAASTGPGSFTGLRIGIATLKGLAFGLEKPCVGVSTLEAMAYNMPFDDCVVCACMDARVGQVYNGIYDITDKQITCICEDRAVTLDELQNDLSKIHKKVFLVGDGAKLCYNQGYSIVNENIRYQNAYGVAKLAQRKLEKGEISDFTPKYLRLPQAERERLEKLKEKA